MPNYDFIGKTRLPRGDSYPISRSIFDAFLDREHIQDVTGVAYCGRDQRARLIAGHYYAPRSRSSLHSLNLWINAVPSRLRRTLSRCIVTDVFPELAHWIRRFADKTHLDAQVDHKIECYYELDEHDETRIRYEFDGPGRGSRLRRHRGSIRPARGASRR